jgi:UDP-N-acetyl-D-galactosamine dehydrogenase
VAIIGLGYVGLPLAIEFAKKRSVIGYDINEERIVQLKAGVDSTNETERDGLITAEKLVLTSDPSKLIDANIYIVTVPTPVDHLNKPDLTYLFLASETVGKFLKKDDIVVYESTVYPGCTEEQCVPILEKISGLKYNQDFFCGYSPERVNPGDKDHRISNIMKITSGSTSQTADIVDGLYAEIVSAGTHRASSIKIAEAAKVIENTQRDLNISLVNELAIIFRELNIDTEEVLNAAGTKWNFLPFKPGLVGGHCIGVDPYYLTYKAQQIGYEPQVILAGRRMNDSMGGFVAAQLIEELVKHQIEIVGANILIMGFSFKENCPDVRNTRVITVIEDLSDRGCSIDVFDPCVNRLEVYKEYGINLIDETSLRVYDALILAVAHDEFRRLNAEEIQKLLKPANVVYDLKHILPRELVTIRL